MRQITTIATFLILCSGCGIHSYSPAVTHYPQPEDKGKISVTTALGGGGINVSAAGGITNDLGISALLHTNIFTGRSESSERRRMGEISAYFMKETDKESHLCAGMVFGAGAGDYAVYNKSSIFSRDNRYVNSKSTFNYFFVSPYILKASANGVFNIVIAFKFNYLYYRSYYLEYANQDYKHQDIDVIIKGENASGHPSKLIWEPTIRWSLGKKYFRFFNQLTIPATIESRVHFTDSKLKDIKDFPVPSIQFGLVFSLPLGKEKD